MADRLLKDTELFSSLASPDVWLPPPFHPKGGRSNTINWSGKGEGPKGGGRKRNQPLVPKEQHPPPTPWPAYWACRPKGAAPTLSQTSRSLQRHLLLTHGHISVQKIASYCCSL